MFTARNTLAVVDDEASVGRALGRLLRVHGYAVDLFEEGWSLLRAHEARPYHCILLDLHMPGLSGFEVLEELARKDLDVPVIVITAKDDPGAAERVRAQGAAGYLLKPVDQTPLLEAVGRVIREHSRAAK
jgi:FixJ family two-component response regulator